MLNLAGRTAIITGGAGGIGRGIGQVLVMAGARIVVADLDAEAATAAAGALGATAGQAIGLPLDIASEPSVAALVERSVAHFGTIDILVNNAGIFQARLGLDVDAPDFTRTLDVNTVGLWRMVRAALPHLRTSKAGSIVNIASNGGRQPVSFAPAYCASKAAVLSLTQSLALLVGADGIRVNSVCPGPIDTEMFSTIMALRTVAEANVPAVRAPALDGRLTAVDIGNAVAFLASDLASTVTGQALVVDRGVVLQ